MARLSTHDISTGTLREFSAVVSSSPAAVTRNNDRWPNPSYRDDGSDNEGLIRIAKLDRDCGNAVRLRARAGDTAPIGTTWITPVGTQKAQCNMETGLSTGQTFWVAWSAMFETWEWPTRDTSKFLITDGIHGYKVVDGNVISYPKSSMCVQWGMPPVTGTYPYPSVEATQPGKWCLYIDRHPDGPDEWYDRQILLQVPVTLGRWIDVRMRITLGAPGSVKCWINNQLQTLLTGGTEYIGDVTPRNPDPTEYWRWQTCIYRGQQLPLNAPSPVWGDAVMYRNNLRFATAEADL